MKYLCEFKEFMIMELFGGVHRSRRRRLVMTPKEVSKRMHWAELKKYNVTRSLRDPFGHKGIAAGKAAEAAEAAKAAEIVKSRKMNNLKIYSQKPKHSRRWFAKPSEQTPRSLPQQPVMKPALNVQQKPFYRRFF